MARRHRDYRAALDRAVDAFLHRGMERSLRACPVSRFSARVFMASARTPPGLKGEATASKM
jgi:hypothetical protein